MANDLAYGSSGNVPLYGPYVRATLTYVPGAALVDLTLTAAHFANNATAVFAHFITWSGFLDPGEPALAGVALYSRVYNLTNSVLVRQTYAAQANTVQVATHTQAFGMAFQTFDTSYIGKTVRFEMAYYSDRLWVSDGNDYGQSTYVQVAAS